MAGLYEYTKPLRVDDYHTRIIDCENEDTPLLSLLPDGPAPKEFKDSWPVEQPVTAYDPATAEGADKEQTSSGGTWENHVPLTLEGMCEIFTSRGWLVTEEARLLRAAWETQSSPAYQQAKDALSLKKAIHRVLLSDQEAVDYTAAGGTPKTRGVFSWLQTAAHSVLPVDSTLLPSAAQTYTGTGNTLAKFTSSKLQDMLLACAARKKGAVSLTGLVGLDLKKQMSTFSEQVTTVASVTDRRQAVYKADPNKVALFVDFFEYDECELKVMVNYDLLCTTNASSKIIAPSTTAGAKSSEAGVFLDLAMWQLAWLQRITHKDGIDLGGGPRGFHRAIGRLNCLNPSWQAFVKPAAAS